MEGDHRSDTTRQQDLRRGGIALRALAIGDSAVLAPAQAALADAGIVVDHAPTAAVAIAIAREVPPGVIVADLEDEAEYDALKAYPHTAQVPTVAVVSRADDETLTRLLLGGIQDFVHLPLRPDEVAARVVAVLRDRRRYGTLKERHDRLFGLVVADTSATEALRRDVDHLLQQSHAVREDLSVLAVGRTAEAWADQVGARILQLVSTSVRLADVIGWYRSSTLMIAAAGTGDAGAQLLARRILARARGVGGFDHVVSIGWAVREETDDVEGLLHRAAVAQSTAPRGEFRPCPA